MDVISNPLFWGEVGLAAASKLALLAAVLWVAKMVMSARADRSSGSRGEATSRIEPPYSRLQPASAGGADGDSAAGGTPPIYLNLRRAGERQSPPGNRDALRERLLEYLDTQSARRGHP